MVLVSKVAAFTWMNQVPMLKNKIPKHEYMSVKPEVSQFTFVPTNNLYPESFKIEKNFVSFDPFFN